MQTQTRSSIEPTKVKDPVCGRQVVSGEAPGRNATYEGETYDFCSEECRNAFEANPRHFIAAPRA